MATTRMSGTKRKSAVLGLTAVALTVAACSSSSSSASGSSSSSAAAPASSTAAAPASSTAAAPASSTAAAPASSAAAAPASSASGPATKVRILSYPTSGSSWLAYIALKEGFFTKNGIDASLVSLPAGQQGAAALAGGSLDVGVLDTNNMGPLLAKGGKFTLLTNANVNYWILIGNKKLSGATDLGTNLKSLKAVSVPSLGGSGGREVSVMQTGYGISSTSLQLIADPSSASFTSGRVGAYMTDTLDSCQPLDQGYPKLMDFVNPPEPKASYPQAVQNLIGLAGLGYWTSNSFLAAHPNLASEFQATVAQTITWSQDPANLATIAKLFRGTSWDFPKLTDAQWSACSQRVIDTFSDKYSSTDVTTWDAILKTENVAPLPATSAFLAPGVPQS
jgi:ABC-type nitrate/sulfonate/bicarbonate transport system substrate-binding protein